MERARSRTNVHIYPSPFEHESRILKQTQAIAQANLADRVVIIAKAGKGLPTEESIDSSRTVVRLPLVTTRFGKNIVTEVLAYLELLVRTLWYFRRANVVLVNAHSLSVLPTTVALRICKGAKVIYDTHELETERHGLRGLRKAVSKATEKIFMPFVEGIVVVSPSIADWYRKAYPHKPIEVVRNIPARQAGQALDRTILRSAIGANDNEVVFIYQGIFGADRGIEAALAAFETTTNARARCVFMGAGPLEPDIRAASKRSRAIDLMPPVKPHEVLSYSCGADVGLCLIVPSCLSYAFCLPNKLFEYISAGLPVLVSPGRDMGALVSECDCGWIIPETARSLASFLDTFDTDDLARKRLSVVDCSRHLQWRHEADRYATMIGKLIGARPALA